MRFRGLQYVSALSLLLVGCGGGGSSTTQPAPTIKAEDVKPLITLTATPTSIAQGSSTKLTWTSSNATSVTIDNGIGSVGLNDSRQVTPSANTTYTATATGAGGVVSASVNVTVIPPPAAVSVLINPSIIKAGSTATLTWTSSNATAVTFDNGIGNVPPSGSRPIAPTETTTYAATATGPGGASSSSAKVDVVFPPTIALSASPASITKGDSTTLQWNSSNADSVSINNNIGDQAANGSVSINPASTTVYIATATGPGGTASTSFTVNVSNPATPTVSVTATPAAISAGQVVTLAWRSTNGTSAIIDNGVGNVALNGSFQVSPGSSKTFTITVNGAGGSASAMAAVNVLPSSPIVTASPLKHVVVVMMQNNSFDHLFGLFPATNGNTVDGLKPGVPGYTQTDAGGKTVTPFLLADDAPPPLPEGDVAYRQVLTAGMDKFAFYNGELALGYYDSTTLGVSTLWQLAQQFTLADKYFGSVVGEAPTNQLYMVAAADLSRTFDVQPAYGPCEIADNSAQPYTFPNLADQLEAKGLGWGVFQQSFGDCNLFMGIHNPFQFFTSTHDSSNIQDYANFSAEIQNDILPAFSLIIPDGKHDMHPGNGSISNGITFLQSLVQQVQSSPVWNSTAIIVTFDTGGGWYDHVFPPSVDSQGLAFRVPTLVISPYAKKNYVSHALMDHVSVLKLVQWNWALPSLNTRNAASGDMFDVFDFSAQPQTTP